MYNTGCFIFTFQEKEEENAAASRIIFVNDVCVLTASDRLDSHFSIETHTSGLWDPFGIGSVQFILARDKSSKKKARISGRRALPPPRSRRVALPSVPSSSLLRLLISSWVLLPVLTLGGNGKARVKRKRRPFPGMMFSIAQCLRAPPSRGRLKGRKRHLAAAPGSKNNNNFFFFVVHLIAKILCLLVFFFLYFLNSASVSIWVSGELLYLRNACQ